MKPGDIVYFKSVYVARYCKEGGSYDYRFKPGDRYLIQDMKEGFGPTTGGIKNLEDGTTHFAHSSHWERLISQEEWRQLQLDKLV